MAAPAISQAPQQAAVNAIDTRWGKLLIPSLSDLFYCALLASLFGMGMGWSGLVMDGDTGWHIRTGEYILQNGSVPHQDIFSWSKEGAPWFAWEWLTDVIYAVLHERWGLGGVAVFSGLLICASAYVLLRSMLWMGANAFVAGVLTLLYAGASSMHHHARPHIWTLFLFAVTTGILVRDRKKQDRVVWLLIPITCLWTNLHGGFLAGIAMVGLTAVGVALESPRNWRGYARYLALAAGCAAASVVNPYGIQLHVHVAQYLGSDFITNMVQEFQAPRFRSEADRQFELVLLLGLICAGRQIWRKQYAEALWILYFAHVSLSSVRHAPLFMIAASPVIAMQATEWWNSFFAGQPKNSIPHILHSLAGDISVGMRRTTFWLVVGVIPIIAATTARSWPTDFGNSFPQKMVARYGDRLEGRRLFTVDQWGDYILYKKWPKQKVFVDGRSDFYGATMGDEYLSMMNADYRWNEITKRYGFDLMLLPVKWPLASVLKLSPEWRLVTDDGTAILFERRNLRK